MESKFCCRANSKNWNWTSFDWLLIGTYWKSSLSSCGKSSLSLGSNENEICVGKLDVEVVGVVFGLVDVAVGCSSFDANLSHTWLHVTVVCIGDGVLGLSALE